MKKICILAIDIIDYTKLIIGAVTVWNEMVIKPFLLDQVDNEKKLVASNVLNRQIDEGGN